VDIYGMLSLKDIAVENWGQDRQAGGASTRKVPVVPIRTPLFNSRIEPEERASEAAETAQQAGIMVTRGAPERRERRQDAPIERGADLSRPWVLFLEEILRLLKVNVEAAARLRKLHAVLCWIDETETRDIWATIGDVDATTDPLMIAAPLIGTPRTTIPPYAEAWAVGDYVLWNDPARGDPMIGTVSTSGLTVAWVSGSTFDDSLAGNLITINGESYTVSSVEKDNKTLTLTATAGDQAAADYTADSFRRRYECGQITAIDADTGAATIRRHWPESQPGHRATFESYMETHGDVRLYRVHTSLFTHEVKPNTFLTDENTDPAYSFLPADARNRYSGLPRRWDITLPHAAVVAVYVAAENEFGMGPWTGINTSYPYSSDVRLLPAAPGLRTHVGASYWFEEPGDIEARTRPDGAGGTISTLNFYPTLPIRIQDWASIRTMYGFVGQPALNPAAGEPVSVRVKILYAANRIDGKELYDPTQPWQNLETLSWQKLGALPDICSADQGSIDGIAWLDSQLNPPAERRMPYCEGDGFFWDPEGGTKAWPTPVMEADAWLTFDVLTATLGTDSNPPADLTVVIQT
jgi:hypothetical protein